MRTRQSNPNLPIKPCLLGAHFSIAKGLHQALYDANHYGCNAAQIFTKNANTWKERTLTSKEIELFKAAQQDTGILDIASHTSYLINLATQDQRKLALSREALKQELKRCTQLGIPWVVLHPGAHMGAGAKEGIKQIAAEINILFEAVPDRNTGLALEATAGQGSSIGHCFEHLSAIMDAIKEKVRLGICLDTCHIFAAGYDLRTVEVYEATMAEFDRVIGLQHLKVIHLNDSKKELGTRVDRHANIGEGHIGIDTFRYLMNDQRLVAVPKILETPKKGGQGQDLDAINLKRLRKLIKLS
ncbi:MAG: deoxyribonuclease IV [Desulfobacterales bacterium]|nr:deoxyribonuclease IV [Desulfobacterales bacterium]